MADTRYGEDSQAVQAHLGIMQSVIQRMAANSASSKAWCVALVSAILVLIADKGKAGYVWIAVIPTFLFMSLDVYYLTLEKGFRESYNAFIDKLHSHTIAPVDLYAVVPAGSTWRHVVAAVCSFSIWPMYATLLAMIYLAGRLVAKTG